MRHHCFCNKMLMRWAGNVQAPVHTWHSSPLAPLLMRWMVMMRWPGFGMRLLAWRRADSSCCRWNTQEAFLMGPCSR